MAKPVANFNFDANGLSVKFTDGSSGIINSWAWDFGYKVADVEVVSSQQNPDPIVFPSVGGYTISLTVINNDGSNTFTYPIVVSDIAGLNISIRQMVQYNLPTGLAYDSIGFEQSIRAWQLYLQAAAKVSDADIFDETKWSPLFNVLISKLIIYDLVVKAATASMSSFIAAAESLTSLVAQTTGGTTQVADYTISIDKSYPFIVNLLIANGVSFGPSPSLANDASLLAWLNGLGAGVFAFTQGEGDFISSFGNSVILTTFNYTANGGGHNGAFNQSNARVVPISQTITGGTSGAPGSIGALKSLETGPSKAAWYDASVFWSNLFKATTTGANGSQGGILGSIQGEICMYSSRLGVQMPGCPKLKTLGRVFQVAHNNFNNCRSVGWPASKGLPWT